MPKTKGAFLAVIATAAALAAICFAAGEDLARFLRPAACIDSGHPEVIAKAREITRACRSDSERVKALYEFVRDGYTNAPVPSFQASEVLRKGGNSCRQRSILLAALCRAVGIPARLGLQKVTLKGWKNGEGQRGDLTFAHGISGIFVDGVWRWYEPVGNRPKWIIWTQDEKRGDEMPLPFRAGRDCLFPADDRILIETLPDVFADRTAGMIALIEKIDGSSVLKE